MHVSLQLGYQNDCDIETALLSDAFDGVDKCQCVVLLTINDYDRTTMPVVVRCLPPAAQTKDHMA